MRCTQARLPGSAGLRHALQQGWGSVHAPGHLTGFACAGIVEEAPKQGPAELFIQMFILVNKGVKHHCGKRSLGA